MKVVVSAFSNLYTDQRIEKVCRTLQENDFAPILIGNDWGGTQPISRTYPVEIIKHRASSLRGAYAEFQWKLYRQLSRHITNDTILLANDLDALLPNVLLSKKHTIPLVYDSHEIFTEMPAIQGRWTQKVWRALEARLMPHIRYMMTESVSYADWFQSRYGIRPVVVRNIPRKIEQAPPMIVNQPKVILYQGVINQSRGLRQAILAMKNFLPSEAVFHIIGDGPMRKEYEALVKAEKLENQVKFLGKMLPEVMREHTKKADVGLSLEENGGVSYYYSLPNKVADYIQARVPSVMINFPEMQRVHNEFKVGELTTSHDPEKIAEHIKTVLQNGRTHYLPELDRAAQSLCWEQEEQKIIDLFRQVAKDGNII